MMHDVGAGVYFKKGFCFWMDIASFALLLSGKKTLSSEEFPPPSPQQN